MKQLNFNRKSWHSALYQSSYGTEDLPDNICAYFWKLVLAIILIIPAFGGHIINMVSWSLWKAHKTSEHYPMHSIRSSLHIPIFILFASLTITDGDPKMLWWGHIKYNFFNLWWTGGIIVICIIMVILLLVLAALFFDGLTNHIKKIKRNTDNPIKEGWKAFRGKYCSKISWN